MIYRVKDYFQMKKSETILSVLLSLVSFCLKMYMKKLMFKNFNFFFFFFLFVWLLISAPLKKRLTSLL